MKNLIVILAVILTSCSALKNNSTGTFIDRGYTKSCGQLSLYNNSTYEYVICGELQLTYEGTWKMDGDTINFKGWKRPSHHSKFLYRDKKLFKIKNDGRIEEYWTFKKKRRIPRPYKTHP